MEEILRRKSGGRLNIFGVEVMSCPNKYLPDERLLRVPTTTDVHRDGILAEALLFVYPRRPSLIEAYLNAFVRGALQVVLLILNRTDSIEFAPILEGAFSRVEIVDNCGLPAYEVLAVASQLKVAPSVPSAG